jgi:sugar lactone lactonase YvrE
MPHANIGGGVLILDPAKDSSRGTLATFGGLQGITYDPATNTLVVCETDNGLLRNIALNSSNGVATIAGTQYSLGYRDGAGTTALFWSLGTVANDGKVVYVADNSNAVIRTYDLATGNVATFAGQPGMHGGDDGPAAMAKFDRPEGVFIDGTTLYVTDGDASTIRKIDLGTKMVSTIAGQFHSPGSSDGIGTAARFGYPVFVVGDHADHLFISELGNTIRRLTISTGEVKTIAGAANMSGFVDAKVGTDARFSGTYGLAIDGKLLYVCDASAPFQRTGAAIRAVDLDSFAVTTVAGSFTSVGIVDETGDKARLNNCSAMVADGRGHVYFGDTSVLRKLDVKSGAVSSVAGKPSVWTERPGPLATATLNAISGLTLLPSGDLVFDDALESALLEVRMP